MTLLIFLIILSILVIIHEFGHFIVAKRNGVAVEEFGLGIPPRIYGKKIGGTVYSINLLPFGGFVKLLGEDSDDPKLAQNSKSLMSKTPWQKSKILLAGVFMNFILAVFLYYTLLISNNFTTPYVSLFFNHKFTFGEEKILGTVITGFMEDSPLGNAGVYTGEAILKIDDTEVSNVSEVKDAIKDKLNSDVKLTLLDLRNQSDSGIREVTVQPMLYENDSVILGVYLGEAVELSYKKPLEKIFSGFLHSYNMLSYSTSSLSKIVGLSVKTRDISPVSQSVSGPVGIYNVVGGILDYSGDRVVTNLIDFGALISLSLAFLNVLPFPALDGGRLVFTVLEGIRGKKVNPNVESKIHGIGMLFLLGFLLLVTIKDIAM